MPARSRADLLLNGLLQSGPRVNGSTSPGFASDQAPTWYAPDLPLVPVDLDLELELDFAGPGLSCTVTTTVRSTRDGARTLVLDAVGLLDLMVEEPDGKALRWRYDGQRIHLDWAQGVERGAFCRVRVEYRVHAPITGLHGGGPTPAAPTAGRFLATDHETERARYWLPCVDHPSVRPTATIALSGPAGLRYLASGRLVGEASAEPGRTTVRWRLDHPCPSYLLCFVAGELVAAEDAPFHDVRDGQDKPVAFFAPPPCTAEDLARTFGRTREFLGWLTDTLDRPLPWPKYYQFAAPGIGGAMENISLVSWDDAWVADPRLHAELGWLADLVNVHEMSHTWFGDQVVCRDFAHSWLKESWATYMESAWIEAHWGTDDLHAWLHVELRTYLAEADERYQRPIVTRRFDSSWDLFDAHLYPGGAVRLHLLRRTLGDDVFWAGVRAYLSDNAGQVVETDTFRRAMEAASDRSLGRFFDQWFHSPGCPRLEIEQEWKAEDRRLTITVVQAQIDADKGIPAFETDLHLAVEDEAGTWHRATLALSGPRHVLSLELPVAPVQIVVDPDSDCPTPCPSSTPATPCSPGPCRPAPSCAVACGPPRPPAGWAARHPWLPWASPSAPRPPGSSVASTPPCWARPGSPPPPACWPSCWPARPIRVSCSPCAPPPVATGTPGSPRPCWPGWPTSTAPGPRPRQPWPAWAPSGGTPGSRPCPRPWSARAGGTAAARGPWPAWAPPAALAPSP